MAVPRCGPDWADGPAQLSRTFPEEKATQLEFGSDLSGSRATRAGPSVTRGSLSTSHAYFSRCRRGECFSRSCSALSLDTPRVAGGFAILIPHLREQDQREHDAGRPDRGGRANLSRNV